jgi:hypothetical protein
MGNHDGSLFNVLKSHKRVDAFRFALSQVLERGESYQAHPALISMTRQLLVERRPLTVKQVIFALSLLEKIGLRTDF